MLDVPVTFDEADFAMSQPDFEAVGKIFDELEFRQLLQNFLKPTSQKLWYKLPLRLLQVSWIYFRKATSLRNRNW